MYLKVLCPEIVHQVWPLRDNIYSSSKKKKKTSTAAEGQSSYCGHLDQLYCTPKKTANANVQIW
jgi:hypothetical protein